jgi:hypothetical protein
VFRDELEMSSQVNMDTESYVADALELPSQLTRRVDALYLLSLLLTGSQRGKVQEILAKLGIGPLLSALFEQFLWKLVFCDSFFFKYLKVNPYFLSFYQ